MIPEGTYDFHIEAEDTSGNVTVSAVVTVHITPDGGPPPGDGDGDDGGDGDGDGGDGGDGGIDSDGADDGNGDGGEGDGGEDPGALPPGYGNEFGGPSSASGCECSASGSSRGGVGFGLLFLGLLGLRAPRRRRIH